MHPRCALLFFLMMPVCAHMDVAQYKLRAQQAVAHGDIDGAYARYAQLLALQPGDATAAYNVAYCLSRCNHMQAACYWYEQALRLQPDDEVAKFGLAKARLACGDYEHAWDLFEWRYGSCAAMHKRYNVFGLTPASFVGKEVVLVTEWGMGDAIMCMRYAHDVKRAGATRIIVQVPKPLVPLVRLCLYIDEVITPQDMVAAHTVDVPLFTLPRIFGTTIETIPTPIPYLFADEQLEHFWQQKLVNEQRFKVGICWSSHESNLNEPLHVRRSIPLSVFEPLAQLPGVCVYSLQKGFGTQELDAYGVDGPFEQFAHFDEVHGPFMDTVAIMKQLDVVITADTSLAHIAGALGCATWVLLPYAADWRWLLERSDSPWYPTVRLFRQTEPGNWHDVMQQVVDMLRLVGASER